MGKPSFAKWTRIWCVRPVLMVTSSSVQPVHARTTCTSEIERLSSERDQEVIRGSTYEGMIDLVDKFPHII